MFLVDSQPMTQQSDHIFQHIFTVFTWSLLHHLFINDWIINLESADILSKLMLEQKTTFSDGGPLCHTDMKPVIKHKVFFLWEKHYKLWMGNEPFVTRHHSYWLMLGETSKVPGCDLITGFHLQDFFPLFFWPRNHLVSWPKSVLEWEEILWNTCHEMFLSVN